MPEGWAMVLMGTLMLVIFYLPDTWKGVEMQGPYGELLREVHKDINYWKTKKGATSVTLGCDAQVEFQQTQEPFTGCGLRGGKTKNIQDNNLEIQFEAEFLLLQKLNTYMEWLLDTLENKEQLMRWRVLNYVAIPQGWT